MLITHSSYNKALGGTLGLEVQDRGTFCFLQKLCEEVMAGVASSLFPHGCYCYSF